ncbi:HepT-like ribonuclease domain-containing protein [Brenneria corticis]|uniref:HepT-like ribonuclease domain-containing protein n=1 Tax=Brenneria corticis TaxID=2173106 RepID=UPI001FF0405E|nr:HepT-like ribonuclease domain-containing protein [Brenneria sp. CFCC 11842]
MVNYLIRRRQLGIPQSGRDSFSLLVTPGIILNELSDNLQKIVGLRNIAVHDCQALRYRDLRYPESVR